MFLKPVFLAVAAATLTGVHAHAPPAWSEYLPERAVHSGGIENDLDGNASALVASDALFLSGIAVADGGDSGAKVTTLMRQPLPDYPGKDGVLATVEFAAGHVDPAHRHPGHVFAYLLEGSVVGQSVSKTEPGKLLVFFVTDRNAPPAVPPQRRRPDEP